ncbi:MAG: TPM domain-containing protein [Bacillaceae bacterium]|nr:TPM domain-containing protein [Bacillaceae bacterium]
MNRIDIIHKIGFAFVLFMFLTLTPYGVIAAPFPEAKEKLIQDEADLLDETVIRDLSEQLQAYGETYKIVIVESFSPLSDTDYARSLFDHFELGEQSILFVLSAESNTLAFAAGSSYDSDEVNEMIGDKIEHYFDPYALQQEYGRGILLTVQQVHEGLAVSGERTGVSVSAETGVQEDSSATSLPWWLMLLFVILAGLIIYAVYSFIQRRRLLQEIDQVDEWKEQLNQKLLDFQSHPENKQRFQQIGKAYASMKKELDRMSGTDLSEVEVLLVDAEDYCDRLRYRKGWAALQQAEDILQQIETNLEALYRKLEKSTNLLEKNVTLLEEAQQVYATCERLLSEYRFTYSQSFHELKDRLNQLGERVESLNNRESEGEDPDSQYEVLNHLLQSAEQLKKDIQDIPAIRKELEEGIMRDIQQLHDDISTFYEQGFHHDEDFKEVPGTLHETLHTLRPLFEEGKMADVRERMTSIRDTIEHVYDLMEEAVSLKKETEAYQKSLRTKLRQLAEEKEKLEQQVELLSHHYNMDGQDVKEYLEEVATASEKLEEQYHQAEKWSQEEKPDFEQALRLYREIHEQIENVLGRKEAMLEELNRWQGGEEQARETWKQLNASLVKARQTCRRHNLPGIPEELRNSFLIARSALDEVKKYLNESPLPMNKIEHYLEEARERVESYVKGVEQAIFHSEETEKIIQMTNRYRSRYPEIEDLLLKSEEAFRSLQYEEAYRLAREAQERVGKLAGSNKKKWLKK